MPHECLTKTCSHIDALLVFVQRKPRERCKVTRNIEVACRKDDLLLRNQRNYTIELCNCIWYMPILCRYDKKPERSVEKIQRV